MVNPTNLPLAPSIAGDASWNSTSSSSGVKGDEGSRKRGDALGSLSGSEEEEVWWSRRPSALPKRLSCSSPGQDTSLHSKGESLNICFQAESQ